MDWIKNYDLFLFDFDGLLVNTEEMHYKAYRTMMKERGFELTWSFDRYCQAAHYGATALKDQIYEEFPALKAKEGDWSKLYHDKQQAMLGLIEAGGAHLMPGVSELLERLEKESIRRVVVTHSPEKLISKIRLSNPLLNTIPHWVTREQYKEPKPSPECYMKAINMYSKPRDKIIGFEDTPRGLTALISNPVTAVLICQAHYPEIILFQKQGVKHYPSLLAIPSQGP